MTIYLEKLTALKKKKYKVNKKVIKNLTKKVNKGFLVIKKH